MSAIKFTLDGLGPFNGEIWYDSDSSGQIEFIAIPEKEFAVVQCRVIRVKAQDRLTYTSLIDRIILEQSTYDIRAGTTSGLVYFRTLDWILVRGPCDNMRNRSPIQILPKPLLPRFNH